MHFFFHERSVITGLPSSVTLCDYLCAVLQCKVLEQRLEQGMVFTEYERVQKKRLRDGECSIARLPENAERNRFQDVLPYDDTRVELVPTKENNTGYINASHIKVREMLLEKRFFQFILLSVFGLVR